MATIYAPKKPQYDARLLALPIVIGILSAVLLLRLWYVQVVLGPELVQQASNSNQSNVKMLAPRGLIYDRNGKLIAGVQPEIIIEAVPKVLKKNPDVLGKVANLLGVSDTSLMRELKKGSWKPKVPTPIYVDADIHQATKIVENSSTLPGITVATQPMRYYPDSKDFTHVLGYVWVPDKNDVKRFENLNLKLPQFVGKFGVEWFYEKALMGVPGNDQVISNSKLRPIRVLSQDAPTPGDRLQLCLDGTLQKIANTELAGHEGAAVAIDPNTGGVLCMVSAPSYDLSLFQGGISEKNYSSLENNPGKPFQNRAVNGFFPPGSTFKIITSIAMERTGVFDPNAYVDCEGGFHIGKAIIRCDEDHGPISYVDALAKSCNTYFCSMGTKAGPDAIRQAAFDAGLGEKTGIDLRSELNGGVIPTDDYVKKVRKGGHWYGGDTANMAIGQGFVLASPLQMADIAEMVANRGTIFQPHLLHSIQRPGQSAPEIFQPKVIHQVNMSEDFWNYVYEGMEGSIKYGTGTAAQIPGLVWCGKTGTAQHGKGKKNDAWFIGFAPADHPKIVVAVLVQDSGYGGDFAAPIARDLVKAYLFPESNNRKSATPDSNLASSSEAH